MTERDQVEAKVTVSSGNVFADLGLEVGEEDLLKLALAREITAIINRGKLTQQQVADIIGADQAKVSSLVRGRLKGFSVQRLIRFLMSLGYDVDLHLTQQGGRAGAFRVHGGVKRLRKVAR